MATTPRKLTTMSDLWDSGFGQPRPRHGLRLLYWFAKKCISVSEGNDMILLCDMQAGDFGFHKFENRFMRQNKKLLPDVGFPYFLLGNLNSPGAEMLPDYVKEINTGARNCNSDRIIVTDQGGRKFGKIYLTKHKGQYGYDPQGTFHISRGLLMTIRDFPSLYDFLQSLQTASNNMVCHVGELEFHSVSIHLDFEIEAFEFDTEATKRGAKTPCENCGCIIL